MKILKNYHPPSPPQKTTQTNKINDRMHMFRHTNMITMYLNGRERDLI